MFLGQHPFDKDDDEDNERMYSLASLGINEILYHPSIYQGVGQRRFEGGGAPAPPRTP